MTRPSFDGVVSWKTNAAAACVLWLLCCGCIGYSPQPIDPFDEIARLEQRASSSHDLEIAPPGPAEWLPVQREIDLADGLDLREANALALFYAPEVRAARIAADVSAAQLLQAGLLANPELFLGPRFSTSTGDLILPASLSWELPLWGKRGAEENLAEHRLSAAHVRVIETELGVLTEVRASFVRIAEITRTLQVLEARLRGSQRVFNWVAALRRAGEVDAVTSFLVQHEFDEAREALALEQLELTSARNRLFETVGLLPNAELSIALEPDPLQLPDLPALLREKLLRHPTIDAAHAEYRAAEAALKLEVAKQYPTVRVGPEFEDDAGDTSIGVGVGIELPLFDRNRGGVIAAEEQRDAARERFRATLLELSHAEARARAEWSAAERILEIHRAGALANAEHARESLELRLQTGQSAVLEVLAALRALTSARAREIELGSSAAIARFRTAVAGGAIFTAPSRDGAVAEDQ